MILYIQFIILKRVVTYKKIEYDCTKKFKKRNKRSNVIHLKQIRLNP